MAAGGVALLANHSLFSPSPWAIGGQVAAASLMLWARRTFGRRSFHATADPTEGGLVTTGPYRFIRHPIYTAACLFVFSGAAAHFSAVSAALFLLVLAGALLRMAGEERLVVLRYPEYREYAARTWRMVPYLF